MFFKDAQEAKVLGLEARIETLGKANLSLMKKVADLETENRRSPEVVLARALCKAVDAWDMNAVDVLSSAFLRVSR